MSNPKFIFNPNENVKCVLNWCNDFNKEKSSIFLTVGVKELSGHVQYKIMSELPPHELIPVLAELINILRQGKSVSNGN